jgi:hypothetical protein
MAPAGPLGHNRAMTASLIIQSIVSGIVATIVLDLWQRLLRLTAGIPVSNWAVVGRWFAYLPPTARPECPSVGHSCIDVRFLTLSFRFTYRCRPS